ncbi:FAD-dependent oxidoreductase [Mycobacterium deserti]|uniref:FAD-dependent oxidoreductase n=1 Tax=Mycobacterium deserti TaxID=2978347 RepID=A0ABT2M7S2_9MYCO|nr:FAD-dependent oxidoreductase [Mycobacterium deserti]MCT7658318.1 FAD-dependent oxidoreductase [Mycobacterium deserti]
MSDKTTCAVVGGGPAGLFLGLMLARAGIDVTVLEKHADFLRDFRGDTVHPITMRLLDELGLFERFDELPHSKVETGQFDVGGRLVTLVDFRRLRQPHPYVAMVPQWDLLDLIADAAKAEPTFTLRMQTEVTGLLRDGSRVTGVRYTGPDGPGELRSDLVVGCDGRTSAVRRDAALPIDEFPVPFDVCWFRLPHDRDGQYSLIPRTRPGRALIMIPREGYFQIAYLIPKGSYAQLCERGLDAFHRELAEMIPEASPDTITSWDDVKVLDVRLDRLRRWHTEGVLCIGDAAHAMSPVGGVGINLAIADAVAAASILAQPLRNGQLTNKHLEAVRRRRIVPTVVTQTVQRVLHRRVLDSVLQGGVVQPPAALLKLVDRLPQVTAVPAYIVGVGVLPQHAPGFARR